MKDQLINAGLATYAGQNQSIASGGTLSNPFEIPQQIVLTGTVAAAATDNHFYLDDSCGLSVQLGLMGGDNGVAFTATGGISVSNIKEFLKTHAIIIGGYNFESTAAGQLTQNLKVVYPSLDGNSKSKQLFSAKSVSNMQQNPNLLNVDQNFVWTNLAGLRIAVVPDADDEITYTFTFNPLGAVPYGKLDEFLAIAKVPENSRMSC